MVLHFLEGEQRPVFVSRWFVSVRFHWSISGENGIVPRLFWGCFICDSVEKTAVAMQFHMILSAAIPLIDDGKPYVCFSKMWSFRSPLMKNHVSMFMPFISLRVMRSIPWCLCGCSTLHWMRSFEKFEVSSRCLSVQLKLAFFKNK